MSIVFALATLFVVFAVPTAIVCWLVAKPGTDESTRATSSGGTAAPHS